MADERKEEPFRFNINDLTYDAIMGMPPADRSHIYAYLGLEYNAKVKVSAKGVEVFKYWNIDRYNENCATSKMKLLDAIDAIKAKAVEAQREEIFESIQEMTNDFAGVEISQEGAKMILTISDHAEALAYVRRAPRNQRALVIY